MEGFFDPNGKMMDLLWKPVHIMFLNLLWVLFSLPVPEFLRDKVHVPANLMKVVGAVALLALTFISISYVAVGSYNPFIYFNF